MNRLERRTAAIIGLRRSVVPELSLACGLILRIEQDSFGVDQATVPESSRLPKSDGRGKPGQGPCSPGVSTAVEASSRIPRELALPSANFRAA